MNSDDTRDLLVRFYEAMSHHDGNTMASLYADHARFEDPVFNLQGAEIGRMWKGLMSRAKGFSSSYTITRAEGLNGTARCTARYFFGGKALVVNVILAEFRCENGLIVEHRDTFDFPRWAAQAMGPPGRLFGRFQWFRRIVSRRAAARLGVPPKL
jgi:hypothetical protein